VVFRAGAAVIETGQQLEGLHRDAKAIFLHALEECNIARAFDRHMHFEGGTLVRHPSPVVKPVRQAVGEYKKIFVIAFGKGALPMLDALVERMPPELRSKVHGVCSSVEEPEKRHRHVRYFQGGHPLPNEDSFAAAQATLDLLRKAKRDTFIFFLISGGGSAMLELPLSSRMSLDDTRAFHETLVSSGANITEINTVRKYFSAVKGGRLAKAAPEAEKLSLLLADVPLRDLALVASSPTLPDPSTFVECEEILDRFELLPKFPSSVREYFLDLRKKAPKDPELAAFERTQLDTLLSNHDFVNAARDKAKALGYRVIIDNSCDNWAYDEAAAYLLKRFHTLRRETPKVCLLSSGEVTVALDKRHGCGGRNQHFALEAAFDLGKAGEPLAVLSAGSDGMDGNSPAAGAIADTTTIARARELHFDPEQSLAQFNSCPLFTALGDAMMTGPTNNNLRDIRILLAPGGE
jgi:hydroxypyruvate reductase